jgi:hypothetical protein
MNAAQVRAMQMDHAIAEIEAIFDGREFTQLATMWTRSIWTPFKAEF